MEILLDTHVWLWAVAQPDRIADTARDQLEDHANQVLLSAASSWEIAIKYALGKLALPEPPERFIPPRLVRDGITPLPVSHQHAAHVAALPPIHRDPFDRMLISQAQLEGLVLFTADRVIADYQVQHVLVV